MQFRSFLNIFLLSLVALQQLDLGSSSRILAAFFFPGKSHFMMTNAIIRELVKRGHEVTFITPFSLAKEKLGPNYKEIVIPKYDFWPETQELTKTNTVLEMSDLPNLTFVRLVYIMGLRSTDFAFEQPGVKELINAKDKVGKYDLLLVPQFYNEGALILGHLYQIPVITTSSYGFANFFSQMVGIVSPWSFVPNAFMPYTDRMTLWERIGNVVNSGIEDLMREFSYYPNQDAILQKHFSKLLDRVPSVKELERNISAILLNNYMPLASPRPVSFNMIQVGGLHIQQPKALPEDLQKFLDGATHGAIYFSLGYQVRSADMPPEKLKVFLNVFGSLKQRVLWKFEDETLPNLPANVKVQSWMPQADILAHPNVKVFIAHGGLFGTQEAVHNGVPILGMPIYCDQHLNIHQGKKTGYALGLDYRKVTEEELRESLLELIENPKYRNNMRQASRVFRDRPLSAMDTAMYWINYVIEHRGAPHMVSAGVHLPWYQFYLLDIIGLTLVLILLPIIALAIICRRSSKSINTHKLKAKTN
ncbi:LOW QUALITY PROTEIN: UDP-glucuronosyltransferase 2B15-like [Drosophila serrata]|uniref:UDP-glucuronosyltransferase 2B15-like n=1 Tax=Drosophila serrata TaxID=7274 RepID=UPI000A1D1748|nr:UDP-glucuronosyltransferase 2B15-like [Drosophila serrata]XP_020804466.1 LOW QUALITY PROTEIN: UDP-glucuronosyltransferase 2B15-like [Drosophila serrata]